MPNNILFDSGTFTMQCPSPFDDPSIKKERTDVYSVYCKASVKKSTLHAPTLRAVTAYMKLFQAMTDGTPMEGLGAIGKQTDTKYIAEYISGRGEIQVVSYNADSGSLIASVYANEKASPEQFKHKAVGGNATGSAMFFAAIPEFMKDEEFKNNYDTLYEQFVAGYPDIDTACKAAFTICDNVYRRVCNPEDCGVFGVKIEYPSSGNVRGLTALAVSKGTYSASEVIMGEYKIVKPGMKAKKSSVKVNAKDFAGQYKLSERYFTQKESALIPEIPSWYVIPEQVVTICDFAKRTTNSQLPMRNFMLRGAAGSGKTEGAKAIAAGLGLPYMFLTCSADDEKFDFIGQILPNIEGIDFVDPQDSVYIPSNEEIDEDPAGAYYNMTGDFNDSITPDEVRDAIAKMIDEKNKKREEKDFRYVYTPLIEAIKNGYVIEIQEPTVIAKQGVLVGLNSLLDNCKAIKLITGEVIERHPDTVIILTTNTDYNGCREMNQSIISRMNLIFDMDTPDVRTMTERAMGITGCKDKPVVKKMAETIEKIAKECRESMISDGSCGMRELISWVQSFMLCEDALEAAEYTVLSSVSADSENRELIRSTCIAPVFETA